MKELLEEVKQIEISELARANEKFPLFASNHEAYGVILEEFEETEKELEIAKMSIEVVWSLIKDDMSSDLIEHRFEDCRKTMLLCACEAIQTAAMFEKAICSMEDRKHVVIPKDELEIILKRIGVRIDVGEDSEETEE